VNTTPRMRTLMRAIALVALLTAASAQSGVPVEVVAPETKAAVLDHLFPREVLRDDASDVDFALVLRFRPSFSPERQVTIVKKLSGGFEVSEYAILGQNLEGQLGALIRQTGSDDPAQLAKGVRCSQRRVAVPERALTLWLKQLRQIRLSPLLLQTISFRKGTVSPRWLDTTSYELWQVTAQESSYFRLQGAELDVPPDPRDPALVLWMRKVFADVDHLPAK